MSGRRLPSSCLMKTRFSPRRQYWEAQILEEYRELAKKQNNYFELTKQLRLRASKEMMDWLDAFTKAQQLFKLPENLGGYDIQIFETPADLEFALRKKASDEKHRLSRIIASYDWEYNQKNARADEISQYWEVIIGNWHKPWNRELERNMDKKTKKAKQIPFLGRTARRPSMKLAPHLPYRDLI